MATCKKLYTRAVSRIGRTQERLKWGLRMMGVSGTLRTVLIRIFDSTLAYYFYKLFHSKNTFSFCGGNYHYFYHTYNATWRNERSIEISIVQRILEKHSGVAVLEVGNVLSHYFPVHHDIIDKYEKAFDVINEDVVFYQPVKRYGLIVSISTLEHVGWDEHPREPMKILAALQNLTNCLDDQGKIILTLPVGYNPILDQLIAKGEIRFSELYCLRRTASANLWVECSWPEVAGLHYNFLLNYANGLILGIISQN
jgi:hypothetical protein